MTIEDLTAAAILQRPMDFEETFNSLMASKVAQAIEQQKEELARHMFQSTSQEPEGSFYQESNEGQE